MSVGVPLSLEECVDSFSEWTARLDLAIAIGEALDQYHHRVQQIFGQLTMGTVRVLSLTPCQVELAASHNQNEHEIWRLDQAIDPHDYRLDLHDLGMVLYEVIAKAPYDPDQTLIMNRDHHECKIPITMELILQRLLFKQPSDRYQTVQGFLFDVKKARAQLDMGHELNFFMPGQRDKRTTLSFEPFLYGRDQETAILQNMYQSVCEGRTQYVFVSGYAGVGKTALVTQYLQPKVAQNGFFVSGKYDQYSTRPNQALIQAFSHLTRQLIADEANRSTWRTRILDAMGPNANVMVKLVPELVALIGSQDDYQSSDSQAEANRISLSIKSFLKCFTQSDYPVVLFLDDLHRATQDEISFIESLITEEIGRLFFLGAYRSNECETDSPLSKLIHKMQQQTHQDAVSMHVPELSLSATQQTLTHLFHQIDHTAQVLQLEGLSPDSLQHQLKDVLQMNDPHQDVSVLTALIFKKTHGNPLFVKQLLVFMQKKKYIWFDAVHQQWMWDLEKMDTVTISDNVLDLLTGTLASLPQETRDAIKIAACLGTEFQLQDLAIVTELSVSHLMLYLWHAINQHFLLKVSDHPECLDDGFVHNQTFRFAHDRLQESAYALNDADTIDAHHWHMAKRFVQAIQDDEERQNQKLYWITNAINRGAKQCAQPKDHEWIVAWNLKSAEKSMLNLAYRSALNYLRLAAKYLPKDHLIHPTQQAFQCYKYQMESEFLCGNEQEVERLFKTLIYESHFSTTDKAEIYSIYVKILSSLSRQEEAIQVGIEGLHAVGEWVTRTPSQWRILWDHYLFKWTYRSVHTRPFSEVDDRLMTIKMKMFMEIAVIAHTIDEPKLLVYMIFNIVKLSQVCTCDYVVAHAIVAYGFILITQFNDMKRGYYLGKMAMELVPSIKYLDIIVKIKHIYGSFILPWYAPYQESRELLQETYQLAEKAADYYFGSFADANYRLLTFSLHPLCSASELKAQRAEVKIPVMEGFYDVRQHYFTFLTDQAPQDYVSMIRVKENDDYSIHDFYEQYIRCTLSMIYGFHQEAFDAQLFEEPQVLGNILPMQISDLQFFGFLISLDIYRKKGFIQKLIAIKRQWQAIKKMRRWSQTCHHNFYHRYVLMKAEWAHYFGLNRLAYRYYKVAVQEMNQSQIIMDIGLVYERVAHYYDRVGNHVEHKAYIAQAVIGYQSWGAHAKAEVLGNIK